MKGWVGFVLAMAGLGGMIFFLEPDQLFAIGSFVIGQRMMAEERTGP